MGMITIKNKATEKTQQISSDDWEKMKAKKQPTDDRYSMADLFTVVKDEPGGKLDKSRIPNEFKKVHGKDDAQASEKS